MKNLFKLLGILILLSYAIYGLYDKYQKLKNPEETTHLEPYEMLELSKNLHSQTVTPSLVIELYLKQRLENLDTAGLYFDLETNVIQRDDESFVINMTETIDSSIYRFAVFGNARSFENFIKVMDGSSPEETYSIIFQIPYNTKVRDGHYGVRDVDDLML